MSKAMRIKWHGAAGWQPLLPASGIRCSMAAATCTWMLRNVSRSRYPPGHTAQSKRQRGRPAHKAPMLLRKNPIQGSSSSSSSSLFPASTTNIPAAASGSALGQGRRRSPTQASVRVVRLSGCIELDRPIVLVIMEFAPPAPPPYTHTHTPTQPCKKVATARGRLCVPPTH